MTTYETPGPLELDLVVPAGVVELEASDTATTEVVLEPLDDNDATRAVIERSKVELRPRGEGHELVVEVPSDRGFGFRLGRTPQVRLRVRCPEGARVSVRTRSADVEARGASGPHRCGPSPGTWCGRPSRATGPSSPRAATSASTPSREGSA